ncbi:hypothetical protein [Pseudonocardia sp. ICBG601]|uniref:hypothetical protein n=1 Tax=Pseudonocardia sp. ICBG601 TaxID=2846759 RepID=UPI001CF62D1B|nr:hypothetical protein [Pseudonocardia sp. ICBG601]
MTKTYGKDRRWPVGVGLTAFGILVVLVVRVLNGDSWAEFWVIAAYSVGWASITFAVLYLLSGKFDAWKWGREDHDLTRRYEEALAPDDEDVR